MAPEQNREMGWLFAKDIGECQTEGMTSKIIDLFNWATAEKGIGRTVKVQTITGIACPYIWNGELESSFAGMLGQGVYYEHIFNPVIATLDGKNILLDMYSRFPQMTDIRVIYNRNPRHCLIVNSNGESKDDIRFRMMIEAQHTLVDRLFHLGEVQLLGKTDPEILEKMGVYLQKQEDMASLGMETDRVFDFKELTMEYADVVRAYRAMRASDVNLKMINAEDLRRFAASA